MTNSRLKYTGGVRAVTIALTVAAVAACTPAKSNLQTETKVAAADTARQMPMMNGMPMGQMMQGGCPLAMKSLALTPAQQATFDSIKTEHKASMEKEMKAALERARAVLTTAQKVTFDSASAAHTAMMAKMMEAGGCMK
jgi:Spy/CpxP family protein refolding chaperone